MTVASIILLVYAILMMAGGFFGYKKSGSKASLISGGFSGLVILYGVFMTGTNPKLGFGLISSVTGLLIVVFIIRLVKTKKFMPAGMLLILTIAAFILSFSSL